MKWEYVLKRKHEVPLVRRFSVGRPHRRPESEGLSFRRRLPAALVVLLIAGCSGDQNDPTGPPGPTFGPLTSGASFDWTMPARFVDRNGDGLPDYLRTAEEIRPSSWTVNLDACAQSGSQFVWYVARVQVATVTTCEYAHEFAAEGVYDVGLEVVRGPQPSVWVEQAVTVQDWLIISFGDSYASGEGVPKVPVAWSPDPLFASLEDVLVALVDAQLSLAEALLLLATADANLRDALSLMSLAESAYEIAEQRLNQFLTACADPWSPAGWAACLSYLSNLDLADLVYDDASALFMKAEQNAKTSFTKLKKAYTAASAALDAAQTAMEDAENVVTGLQGTVAAAASGVQPASWEKTYEDEYVWPEYGQYGCHRSANAAPARAALALEEADPRTSVTFLHLACTGAQITKWSGRLQEQVFSGNGLVGEREIDAVLLSIGGNDAGFATIVKACALQEPCFVTPATYVPVGGLCDAGGVASAWALGPAWLLWPALVLLGFGDECEAFITPNLPSPSDESAAETLQRELAGLPSKYTTVATKLFPGDAGLDSVPGLPGLLQPGETIGGAVRSSRVYITEYVDMTKDEDGVYCGPNIPFDPLALMPGFSPSELAWLDQTATRSINAAVETAAMTHGWTFVSGIYDAYRTHGYCAEVPWVVRGHETFLTQGDEKGIAHPNALGLTHNGEEILKVLMGDLYPIGLNGEPRAPDPPTG